MPLSRKALILVPILFCSLGLPAFAENRFTRWWSSDTEAQVGGRQHYHSGKKWPLEQRPTGPCQPYVQRYHTSKYWPDPYRWEDRGRVRETLALQRNNGWITATTLYEQHFDPVTSEINEAGKVHLRWILLHIPPDRRLTWVAAGDDPQTSKVRLASVQEEATLIAGPNAPPVMLRVCLPTGTSAQEVDLRYRSYLESIPIPRVPYIPLNGTSSGSGSNGGSPGGGTPQGGSSGK